MYDISKFSYSQSWSQEDEAFIARVAEFPSLSAHGDTIEEALKELQAVVGAVCQELEAEGASIPEPLSLSQYSGRFNVRIPAELHRELVLAAQRAGVSLNQYVSYKLAR